MGRSLFGRLRGRLETLRNERRYNLGTWAWKLVRDLSPSPPHQEVRFESLIENRPTDTAFILGSGPSLASLTSAQWDHVSRHASFGINYSFLMDFVPTYQIMEDPKVDDLRRFFVQMLAPRRDTLARTTWFTLDTNVRRLIHPRYAPEYFPRNPRLCVIPPPGRMHIAHEDRPIQLGDFDTGLSFRGTKSVVIDILVRMGFKHLVMLGVDLHTTAHFYDEHPDMASYVQYMREREKGTVFDTMIPKTDNYWKHDDYLIALQKMILEPRGISLYMGARDQVIYPRLPLYSWPEC